MYEMLHHPYILEDPQTKRDEIKIGCLTPPFSGPKRGLKCYVTLAFSGIPKQRGKIRIGYLTPAFSVAQRRAETGGGVAEKKSFLRHTALFSQATPVREGGYKKFSLHIYPKFP